ncbi:MAG: hypothetical protein ACHQ51_02850 [Elusimicrobiota bacterium]
MKYPGLVAGLASLALFMGGPSRAQTGTESKTADAVFAAHQTLKRLDAALTPLKQGDYQSKDRRAVLPILVLLQSQLAAAQPTGPETLTPRGATWRKMIRAADDALWQENRFWAGIPNPDAPQKLPAQTAEPLKKAAGEIASAFTVLYPERAVAGGSSPGARAPAGASAQMPPQAAAAVARSVSRGGAASAHPEKFFDGGASRGGQAAVNSEGASAASPRFTRPSLRTAAQNASLPVEPPTSLRVSPVPGPAAAATNRRTLSSYAAFRAMNATAPDALRDAVRATPLVAGAARALTRKPAAPPPAPAKPAEPPPAPESPATTACLQAVSGHSSVSGLCKNSPVIAPLLAGLLEALQEQFGTVEGLVTNLAYLLLGLVLSALTGFGIIAKVVVGLVSFAMLIGTIYPLLKQGYESVKELLGTDAGDVRHARSLLSIGKLGGTVLIMALVAALGWRLGKTATGKAAMTSATEAVSSKLADAGLKDGLAALDAKIPASVRSFLGAPKPSEPASISGFGSSAESIPRSPKSMALVSEQTLLRNSSIADRELRIGAAMKQLGVDRAFAEKIANAHEQVPCRVGKCTQEQLRAKLEIMGRGPEADAAIRSGLAGDPPEGAPALNGAPKAAPFHDATGRFTRPVPERAVPPAETHPRLAPAEHPVGVGEAVGKHFFEDGVIESRSDGIKMAHSRVKFVEKLANQGQIISDAPVPGYPGISLVKYRLYTESRGVVTDVLKAGKPKAKTIVDGNIWTEAKITDLAKSIFGDTPHAAVEGTGTYEIRVTRGRVKFIGWVDRRTGALQSFGVDDILP